MKDILIDCVDGLKGFPDAIQAIENHGSALYCPHMVHHSVKFVPWKGCKAVIEDLKRRYGSVTEGDALLGLDNLSERWGQVSAKQL